MKEDNPKSSNNLTLVDCLAQSQCQSKIRKKRPWRLKCLSKLRKARDYFSKILK